MTDHDTTPGAPETEALADVVFRSQFNSDAGRLMVGAELGMAACDAIAAAVIAAGWISPTEAATRDAAHRADGAETALREAADRVRFVRENGLPDGLDSHPTSEAFEAWLNGRADRIGGAQC